MGRKLIEVTVVVEVPDTASDSDIKDFVDVEFGECGGMRMDNPCLDDYNIESATWKHIKE